MLTQNHAQEGLSRAYLHALAAEARVLVEMNGTFDYGLDGYFDLVKIMPMSHKDGSVVRDHSPALYPIYFQLKSSINWKIENDHIVWSMESRAYNKIIAAGTPVGLRAGTLSGTAGERLGLGTAIGAGWPCAMAKRGAASSPATRVIDSRGIWGW